MFMGRSGFRLSLLCAWSLSQSPGQTVQWELRTLGGDSAGLAANHCSLCSLFIWSVLFFLSVVTHLPLDLIIHWGNLTPLNMSFSTLPLPMAYLSQESEGGGLDCAETYKALGTARMKRERQYTPLLTNPQ